MTGGLRLLPPHPSVEPFLFELVSRQGKESVAGAAGLGCSKSRERLGLLLTHSFFTVCPSLPLFPLPESQKVYPSFVWLAKDRTCDATELLRIRNPGGPVPRFHGHSEEPLAECCGQKFNIP